MASEHGAYVDEGFFFSGKYLWAMSAMIVVMSRAMMMTKVMEGEMKKNGDKR